MLREYGIKLEQKRIFQQDYEVYTGINAFDHFNSIGMIPDAFVCANENIAVGLCQRAIEAGYRVPDDFCITGFDDFDKASYFEPRITTISYSKIDVAYQAMGVLHRIWNGENVQKIVYSKAKPVFQESCGCNNIKHNIGNGFSSHNLYLSVLLSGFLPELSSPAPSDRYRLPFFKYYKTTSILTPLRSGYNSAVKIFCSGGFHRCF